FFTTRVSTIAIEKAHAPRLGTHVCPDRGNEMRPAMPGYPCTAVALLVFALATADSAVAAEAGARLRIGHYSSGNGLIGFVLDRLATPIKLRFDGSDEILALTAGPATYGSVTLKRDDSYAVLRIGEDGRVLLFDERLNGGSGRIYRDQDA